MKQATTIIKNFSVIKPKNDVPAASSVVEDAAAGATGAGAIAPAPVALFTITRPTSPSDSKKRKKKPTIREAVGLQEMNHADQASKTAPVDSHADTNQIIAQLRRAETASSVDTKDTETFGITDEYDNTILVSVSREDAAAFKQYLEQTMSNPIDARADVAELIYQAKDRFKIVDVAWPEVEENEEDEIGFKSDVSDESDELPQDGASMDDAGLDSMPPADAGGASDVESLLIKVIDMMKADADARKADADARAIEAKHKEAKLIVSQSADKIKREEELLDMEAWEKSNREQEREVKQLARLAKWKHALRTTGAEGRSTDDINDAANADEEEERKAAPPQFVPAEKRVALPARATLDQLVDQIHKRVKG